MTKIRTIRRFFKIQELAVKPFGLAFLLATKCMQILMTPFMLGDFFRGFIRHHLHHVARYHNLFWSIDSSNILQRVKLTYLKEYDTVEWINNIPVDDILWDIGANIGMFSMLAGSRSIETVAFEPQAENYALLVKNINNNGLQKKVCALPLALYHEASVAILHVSSNHAGSAMNVFGQSGDNTNAKSSRQAALSLRGEDLIQYGILPPKHIKLDVDGNEKSVLLGISGLLGGVQSLLVEMHLHDKEECKDIHNFLVSHGLNTKTELNEAKYQNVIYTRNR